MPNSTAGARCPQSGMSATSASGSCPGSRSSSRMGPRGCAFSGFSLDAQQVLYNAPQGPDAASIIATREQKTMVELLLPTAPPKQVTHNLKNADSLNPTPAEVLAAALGAPARRVLTRAETLGPRTGWRDGYLTSKHGFCPPDPSASPIALASSPGRVWSDLCSRMPGLVGRGKIREAILELPLVSGAPEVIPDSALWAATVCLGILASVYRYEDNNDGHEGIAASSAAAAKEAAFLNASGEADDEEPETRGIPRNVAIPLRTICTRMGRALPHLTQFDVSIYNFKLRDPTSIVPYVERFENMDLRWPVFGDLAERGFLLCMAASHGCFTPAVELIARCQECVMEKDNEGLLVTMVKLKTVVDQLGYVFHQISVNPGSGENFSNPVEWGQRYAKFSAPLSKRVPALSGLALPLFQLMDAFLGRKKYDSFLGLEALHLRAWLPLNIRAFIAAVEGYYQIPEYVKSTGDKKLIGVLDGIVESYAGERGFMGTHRYKVYGFLEVVAKTGRTETNGGAGAADNIGRPWEEVHKTLSDSMIERLEPFRESVTIQPHEMRGCFEECRFKAPISGRAFIDSDPERSTAKITINLEGSGISFGPGDRLAIMPLNTWKEVVKIADVLGLMGRLGERVSLEDSPGWVRYAKHEVIISRNPTAGDLNLRDIFRKGHLSPLTKETVMSVHILLRASSSTVLKVLASETWPVNGSIGDLLSTAQAEVLPDVWNKAFDANNLSWIPKLIPIEVPRTYSISSHFTELLPDSLDLTVSRVKHEVCPLLVRDPTKKEFVSGVSSGFLNPLPEDELAMAQIAGFGDFEESVLVGISRPLNFQLPISQAAPVAMFAGGSGVAPFRSFWGARLSSNAVGRNILFLGVQSRKKLVYEEELRDHVRYNNLELHTAFSRDRNGLVYDPVIRDLVEKDMEPRYLDMAIIENGSMVCDLVMSTKLGGLGGHLYVCGSVSVYETVMTGLRKAIYNNRTVTEKSADALLATAFAERRFMLDIFMTPRAMSFNEPMIPVSELSKHTGHRDGSKTLIGVHGAVYDVTDFLPIHPGGSLIVAASAGLDATKTFDDLAHTSNPEVTSLLSKYFIGYLAPKPNFQSPELGTLYDGWLDYLRTCVESLTTLSFEVKSLMKDQSIWFSGGLMNMGGIRKFYQFQSRLMQDAFATLFGTRLQELYLKLTFNLMSVQSAGSRFPDVMGIVARAQSSQAATAAQKEIAHIGDMVCNSGTAQSFERGIIRYAQSVTELDVRFLELVREEICTGMDGFELASSMKSTTLEKQRLFKLSAFLISILERVAERLDTYYVELAAQSLYHPDIEENPARARWKLVKRRIFDGSFFLFAQEVSLDNHSMDSFSHEALSPFRALRQPRLRQSIGFNQVLSNATDFVSRMDPTDLPRARTPRNDDEDSAQKPLPAPAPRTLADMHTLRAQTSENSSSSYSTHLDRKAAHRMSTFMSGNLKALKRMSRTALDLGPLLTLDHAMSVYGGTGGSAKEISAPSERSIHRSPKSIAGTTISSSSTARRPSREGRTDSSSSHTPPGSHMSRESSRTRSIEAIQQQRRIDSFTMPPASVSGGERGGGGGHAYAASVSSASGRRGMQRKASMSSLTSRGYTYNEDVGSGDKMTRGLEALKRDMLLRR